MTTVTIAQPVRAAEPVRVGPVTQPNVIRSEWTKFRTVRSTVIVSALTALFMVGLGLLVSAVAHARWDHLDPSEQLPYNLVRRSLIGVFLAQLTVGVLGVLVITAEYTTGMIRATLGAVPRRLPVLWGKLAVFAPVTFILTLAASFAAFLGGQALLGSHGVPLSTPGALRAVFGVALYLTVLSVLALALGFIIRNTAGAITGLFAIIIVLPAIAAALPSNWQRSIVPYLPSSAGQAVYATHQVPNSMHPWAGFALFCGYAAVAVGGAAFALVRRDA
jgi:ABC-type transport system involved in multi-copper enzyme maturation permease subunit